MSKKMPLSKGYEATVDDHWFGVLSRWKWSASVAPDGRVYAVRNDGERLILMHRVITDAPKGKDVDHRDHDGINNQEENLRILSRSEHHANRRKRRDTSSRYKGVYMSCRNVHRPKPWTSYITTANGREHLGNFTSEIEAARAYDARARVEFGELALPNFESINTKD